MARYDSHSRGSPFPLKTGTSKLFFQSSGIFPSVTILLHRSVNHSNLSSSAAANISDVTPDGPVALPFLVFFSAFSTSVLVILQLGPSIFSQKTSLSQVFSSFSSFYIKSFHVFLMPMLSITILPVESFEQFTPNTN